MSTQTSTSTDQPGHAEVSRENHLLLVSADVITTFPLPSRGTLTVGRSSKADIALDEPKASRRHARLCLKGDWTVEDLGSANGTRVGNLPLVPGRPRRLERGETVRIGDTLLSIQPGIWTPTRVHRWPHGTFERILEQQCARAAPMSDVLAVVRLWISEGADPTPVFATLARRIVAPDVFARYGPGHWELGLTTSDRAETRAVLEVIRKDLEALNLQVRMGIAWFPLDGRTSYELMETANARLRHHARALGNASQPSPVAVSPRMAAVIAAVAPLPVNVLLCGEGGVGKEVIGREIHRMSPRRGGPFVTLDCRRLEIGGGDGLASLATAQGGTVYLDHVAEMSLRVQAALLRVLQARELLPLPGPHRRPLPLPLALDVRVLAATDQDLEYACARGNFRRDLHVCLRGAGLTVSPLREQPEDLEDLAHVILAAVCREDGVAVLPRLSPAATQWLKQYSWPGNVRELKNVLRRALLLCEGREVQVCHLPTENLAPAGFTPDRSR
ncbi:MAG: sigma 54-interacting transcriptional regulator [Myxococcales bacterium]